MHVRHRCAARGPVECVNIGASSPWMSTQPRSTVLIRPASLLDAELDLLEALRFAQGEPSLVIDATFEDDLHSGASKAKTKQVVAAEQRMAMMREIRALSKLAGEIGRAHV
jgi:hypothetical protein